MTVYLVGAGPGDPGLLTRAGAELLARCDVAGHDREGGGDTAQRDGDTGRGGRGDGRGHAGDDPVGDASRPE